MSILLGLAAVVLQQSQAGDPLAPLPQTAPVVPSAPPQSPPVMTSPPPATALPQPVPVAVPRDWRGVFDAIRAGQWTAAQAGIASLPAGVLTPVAKAELYTAKGSPRVALDSLIDLLIEAPDLPNADQIQRLAEARGGIDMPRIARRYQLVQIGASPRRGRARPVTGEVEADRLRTDMEAYVKADDAAGAEALLYQRTLLLSPEARAEAAQRIAWIHYVRGDDLNARRVAEAARLTATGEWATHLAWVAGLAAWRQNDCLGSASLFRVVGGSATEPSLRAGGLYWAARSEMACRRPAEVSPLMRAAAQLDETFYGMLARRTLGMPTQLTPMPETVDPRVEALPNVRRATELIRFGERDLAAQFLRFQAQVGQRTDQPSLVALAKRLDLPAAQHFLAHFGQPGARVTPASRYPRPNWAPRDGWRIDPALALAHALQESSFRAEAVSPAGAVGLMQVVPSTMSVLARIGNVAQGDLRDPKVNIEFGQRWIEAMRRRPETQGLLPKVIASYNAGSLPVGRWQVNDRGDPLLWIESVPYWETRFYVPTVLRNMWMYEQLAGKPTPTLTQMAQHRWPAFPTAQ